MGTSCTSPKKNPSEVAPELDHQFESNLINLLYRDLAARSKNGKISKDIFVHFFHLNGLWGEEVFSVFDENKCGEISQQEFTKMLFFLAKGDRQTTIDTLFKFYDLNKSGTLSYSELLKMFYSYQKEDLYELFNDEAFLEYLAVHHQLAQITTPTSLKEVRHQMQNIVEDDTNQTTGSYLLKPLELKGETKSMYHTPPKQKQRTDYKFNVMIKKYTQFLFKEFGLSFRKDQINKEQFEELVRRHPKLYTKYMDGFHCFLWERAGKHHRQPEVWIEGQIVVVGQKNEKKTRYVKFIKEALLFYKLDDLTIPIDIIFLSGLIVSGYKNDKKQEGFIVKSRDGIYPEKIFIVKSSKPPVKEWLNHLKSYFDFTVQDKYIVKEKIGAGAYSIVFQCKHKINGKSYALKMIENDKLSQEQNQLIRSEVEIMSHCHHQNIIKLKEVFETKSNMYIVTELVEDGDLFDYICDHNQMSENEAALVAEKVLQAIRHLNGQGLIHRDIKPENIMVQKDSVTKKIINAKLIDFGFAVYLDTLKDRSSLQKYVGTANYTAPEIICQNEEYNQKVDVFSVGVIVYFMLSGDLPFNHVNKRSIYENTCKGRFNMKKKCWDNVSEKAKDFIRRLLIVDPAKRPTPMQALQLSWLTERTPSGICFNKILSSPDNVLTDASTSRGDSSPFRE